MKLLKRITITIMGREAVLARSGSLCKTKLIQMNKLACIVTEMERNVYQEHGKTVEFPV
jgi:hypothetical protein